MQEIMPQSCASKHKDVEQKIMQIFLHQTSQLLPQPACRASHNGSDNAVRANDVFFAVHALLLTSLTLGQIGIYDRGTQKVSVLCRWAVGLSVAFIVIYAGKEFHSSSCLIMQMLLHDPILSLL